MVRRGFAHEETTFVNDSIFSKDAIQEYVQILERKHDKKRKYGSFEEAVKCCVNEIMILMIITHFYSLIYQKGVSGCFITNCAMVVLV